MTQSYNPIVRTFGQIRAALLSATGLPRAEIRPSTPLAVLLPETRRRHIWRELRQHGLRVPALELRGRDVLFGSLSVVARTLSLMLWLRHWTTLVFAIPLWLLQYWMSRPKAVIFPMELQTVGDLTLYLTSFCEHQASGYRWTRNEIRFKVRLVVAECYNTSLRIVQAETRLAELDEGW